MAMRLGNTAKCEIRQACAGVFEQHLQFGGVADLGKGCCDANADLAAGGDQRPRFHGSTTGDIDEIASANTGE